MAKLSARGRTELARVTKTEPRSGGFTEDDLGSVRVDLTLMSDGVVLTKTTWLKPDGKKDFDTGWKVKAKLTPTARKQLRSEQQATVDRWVGQYEARGYKRA